MKPTIKPVSKTKKISNWLLGYLMWGIVYRYSMAKKIFFIILKLFRKDIARIKEVQGQKLSLNSYRGIIDLRLDIVGTYEPQICEYLMNTISEGMVVIDIGANNGFFSLLAADLVGELGKVICFEPNPTTFDILQQNISLNNYKNIISSQIAISNIEGKVQMSNRTNNALNTLAFTSCDSSIDVNTNTLDKSFKNLSINECHLIIMDIEGAEWLAIQGMENTIAKNPNLEFIIELHKDLIEKLGGTVKEFLQFFVERGFSLYKFGFLGKLKPISVGEEDEKLNFVICKRNTAIKSNPKIFKHSFVIHN